MPISSSRTIAGPASESPLSARAANDPVVVDTADTRVVQQSFSVRYDFPVVFTRDVFAPENLALLNALRGHELDKRHRALVFIDAGIAAANTDLVHRIERWFDAHTTQLELVGAPMRIEAGESLKADWEALEPMRAAIRDHAIDRHSYVIAIGGGALLDAAGLVAATAHRGIRHVRLPSTVLAQNDSGVGVKNGINQYGQKNYLGTFAPPWAVINDSLFLDSLHPRDRRSGMAEAVKVALIRDADFFTWLEQHAQDLARFDADAVAYLVRRCAELHMHQIGHGGDPFELGSARPLDFGHWAAHRLETLTDHALRHGEAVAIGIALDTRYSVAEVALPNGSDERVANLLETLGFRLWHDALDANDAGDRSELLIGLDHFRTHLGGELTVTLLDAIGRGVEVHDMDSTAVLEAIEWLRARDNTTARTS